MTTAQLDARLSAMQKDAKNPSTGRSIFGGKKWKIPNVPLGRGPGGSPGNGSAGGGRGRFGGGGPLGRGK
jgi:hypothetical protein